MKYCLLGLIILFSCTSKKDDDVFYQNKDLYLFKLKIPEFTKLSLKEKLYIYYISNISEELEKIRLDQKNKLSLKIYEFLSNIYIYNEYLDDNLAIKIQRYLYKIKIYNGNYFDMKKFLPDFTFSDLDKACNFLQDKALYKTCSRDLSLINSEIFDEKYKPTLLSSSNYDPVKNSSINLYSDGLSIFNLKTLNISKEDRFSYFYKDSFGKIEKESFCSKYKTEIDKIIKNLNEAKNYATETQALILGFLVEFYRNCDFSSFSEYKISWNYEDKSSLLNGFIEKEYDPLEQRGLMANLLFSETSDSKHLKRYNLYNAIGFFDRQNSIYAVIPPDFNMQSYGSNRVLNFVNVSEPILKFFIKNVFPEYYPIKYKKDLEENFKLFRFKIEETKDTFINNILIDKKNEKLINISHPFLNELYAYTKTILFIIENDTFEYLSVKNASFLAVYSFLTEAVVFSSVFENFNEPETLLVKYLSSKNILDFYSDGSKYFFDFDKEKLIKQLKFLVMDLEELNKSKDIKVLNNYYLEKLYKHKTLNAEVLNNIKTRYGCLSSPVKYFNFISPQFFLIEKDSKIKDVAYKYKFY